MVASSGFNGRLFGPDLPGAGVPVSGLWEESHLILNGDSFSMRVAASELHVEAAGFNAQQLRLSWAGEQGLFAFFIDSAAGKERFLGDGAPDTVRAQSGRVKGQQSRVKSHFRIGALVYAFFLALPLLVLAIFLLNTDRVAGWIADKIPIAYEEKLGDLALAQTRAQAKVIDSGPAYEAVKAIGTKLTQGSRYNYRWLIADNKEVNAFAAPGGVIVVYTGLIKQTDQPEELAGVLAHEVAHVEQRHSLRHLIKHAGLSVLLSLAIGDWSGSMLGGWISTVTQMKFSRNAEMEADKEGLQRMVKAGWDPRFMVSFFSKLAKKDNQPEALSLLSTHPTSEERMQALRQQIKLLPEYNYRPLNINWAAVKAPLHRK